MGTRSVTAIIRGLMIVVALCALAGVAFVTRDRSQPLLTQETPEASVEKTLAPVEEAKVLKLSPQARRNLGLVSAPVVFEDYWRTIQVPGVVVDRPGLSDRGVTSPAVGVVTQVHAFTGDTIWPGEKLFTLRLFSEYLQNTQSELFKATRETQLIKREVWYPRLKLSHLLQ